MEQESCPVCATPYVVFRDFDSVFWRYLCRCEQSKKCSRGRHPATHAKLVPSGDVERYVCDEHGLPIDERPKAPELPPEPAPTPPTKPPSTPTVETPRRKATLPPKQKHDLLTLDGFKAEIAENKLKGRCLQCRQERMLINSTFRPVADTPLFDMVCPHCGHDRHTQL